MTSEHGHTLTHKHKYTHTHTLIKLIQFKGLFSLWCVSLALVGLPRVTFYKAPDKETAMECVNQAPATIQSFFYFSH